MRPIDADLIEFHGLNNNVCPDEMAQDIVDEQPTLDLVQPVRCGECAFYLSGNTGSCRWHGEITKSTDYCSRGKRKDDAK